MTDDDDHDMPTRREDVPHPLVHAARAARSQDERFFEAFRATQDADPNTAALAFATMQLLTIEAGEAPGPGGFIPLPGFLPSTDLEMRQLVASRATGDHGLRQTLLRWARDNERYAGKAAKAVENVVGVYREAAAALTRLRAAEDETDRGRRLGEAMMTMSGWLSATWGVRVDVGYQGPELRSWAESATLARCPSPAWLTAGETAAPTPAPRPPAPSRQTAMRTDPLRPFRANVDDD